MRIRLTVNGAGVEADIEPATLLSALLRERLGLTGTHQGCDTGQCGACTVHVDGRAVKSCLMLAAQADGRRVLTIEGVAEGEALHPVQRAFRDRHALQCGFCTPGMVMTALDLVGRLDTADEGAIRHGLAGNLCRCTGYRPIVEAIAESIRARRGDG
ncbi:(2Fe-2S)-binding protein [Magnetospirillum sp. SS-4]|uniref:(2Fe-2S)-binding protein n=1 Tax=Magnetospirillum sp. SS-4 TaxID=2681465 RepID=UPI00138139B0|nr:(2Fe-2S)-binding protein [Magnetospirillum sp. SS-4]CAA7625199.1 xanthine dehydrogenase, Fe-S binding subunit [Magnetospirillum sp. SS-4]